MPAGTWTCGIPSIVETRSFTNSAVGEASNVGTTVGIIASIVEVGTAVGGILVGSVVDVDSITGTCIAVHAVRKMKETMMNFFMIIIICYCDYMSLRAYFAKPRSAPLNGGIVSIGLYC